MIRILYNLALTFFLPLKLFVELFDSKFAKREREWKKVLNANLNKILTRGKRKTIWIHSASMGEFEQAKPIIEELKNLDPNFFIIVTFFSPSGYENQKQYSYADVLLYLPFDFFWISKRFIDTIRPHIAIFIRYEFWMNYLLELRKRNIPIFLVSATKPKNSGFGLYKAFLKKNLNLFTKIFVIDEEDLFFFKKLNLKVPLKLEYDTRFDRVASKINSLDKFPFSKKDFENFFVIVAGSIWEPDLKLIFEAKAELERIISLKLIYVPHEISKDVIDFIENQDKSCIRFSRIFDKKIQSSELQSIIKQNNILVDRIGLLLSLYSIADVAYVGGGFGKGIHSVVEPAGYFIPVVCGGNISNSVDAQRMKEIGSLWVVNNSKEFVEVISKLRDTHYYHEVSKKMKDFFVSRTGSTKRIIDEIFKYLN